MIKLGNNDGAKIVGRGTIKINNDKIKLEEVLFVVGLKHNLLSVSQIYDSIHDMIFKKKGCEIRREDNGKLIVVEIRTSRNLYTLANISEGSWFHIKEDED